MSASPILSVSQAGEGYDRLAERRSRSRRVADESSLFQTTFIEQLLTAPRPHLEALIKEVHAKKGKPSPEVLWVDYEQAGRMIATTDESIRKLVRKGKLTSVSRSGRHRGIAVDERRFYISRNEVNKAQLVADEAPRPMKYPLPCLSA